VDKRVKRQYPACVFKGEVIRKEVDPLVKNVWEHTFREKAPFGDLRLQWKRFHCLTINPYAGECPFAESQCAWAFWNAVQSTTIAHPRLPVPYFMKVARTTAALRADEAQAERIARRRREYDDARQGDE
jgi:hypothetical protein